MTQRDENVGGVAHRYRGFIGNIPVRRYQCLSMAYNWGRLTRAKASSLSGVSEWTFRRSLVRYDEGGQEGLSASAWNSHRTPAPVDGVMRVREKGTSTPGIGRIGNTQLHWVKSRLQRGRLRWQAGFDIPQTLSR